MIDMGKKICFNFLKCLKNVPILRICIQSLQNLGKFFANFKIR
jgi:hypothetical protein